MSRGQPSKMTLKPPVRTSIPATSSEEEALKRLSALDEWTQEPSKDVAAAIAESASAPEPKPTPPPEPTEKPAKTPVAAFSYPWEGLPQGMGRQVNIRLPVDLYAKLKWLSSFGNGGATMTDIVVESVEKTVKKMLAERGVS